MLVNDRVAIDLGVDHWIGLQRHARCLHEERHYRQLHAVFLLDPLLDARAQRLHGGHVDLVERR